MLIPIYTYNFNIIVIFNGCSYVFCLGKNEHFLQISNYLENCGEYQFYFIFQNIANKNNEEAWFSKIPSKYFWKIKGGDVNW